MSGHGAGGGRGADSSMTSDFTALQKKNSVKKEERREEREGWLLIDVASTVCRFHTGPNVHTTLHTDYHVEF